MDEVSEEAHAMFEDLRANRINASSFILGSNWHKAELQYMSSSLKLSEFGIILRYIRVFRNWRGEVNTDWLKRFALLLADVASR